MAVVTFWSIVDAKAHGITGAPSTSERTSYVFPLDLFSHKVVRKQFVAQTHYLQLIEVPHCHKQSGKRHCPSQVRPALTGLHFRVRIRSDMAQHRGAQLW